MVTADQMCHAGSTCLLNDECLPGVWKCSSHSINTKVHVLYQELVMSLLLYAAEIWTLLVADVNILEAIHMML